MDMSAQLYNKEEVVNIVAQALEMVAVKYMTVEDVAQFLGVHSRTVHEYTKNGILSASSVNGLKNKYYRRSDIEELIEKGFEKGTRSADIIFLKKPAKKVI